MPVSIKADNDDAAETCLASLTYYPIYTHSEHMLNKDWVKIPASLIAKLHVPSGWEASHPCTGSHGAAPSNTSAAFPLFHYLNHPLPYIQLCGMVIDINYSSYLRAWVIQLDDSSGQLVDVLIKKCMDPDAPKQQQTSKTGTRAQGRTLENGDIIPMYVLDWFGCSWAGKAIFDIRTIEIGCILRAKGRLSPWMKGRQLLVERFDIFRSTSQEITFWNQMTEDFNLILRKPWNLTTEKQKELRLKFEAAKIEREKQRRKLAKKTRKVDRLKVVEAESSKLKGNEEIQHQLTADPKNQQEIGPLIIEESSDAHPVNAGLGPSYQIPKVESSSTNESSNNKLEAAKVIGLLKPTAELTGNITSSETLEETVIASDPPNSLDTRSNKSPIQKDIAPTLIDTSAPSQWSTLQLTGSCKSTSVLTGDSWLHVLANAASEQLTSDVSTKTLTQADEPIRSITQEWNELDV